jgi:hypothetical protein
LGVEAWWGLLRSPDDDLRKEGVLVNGHPILLDELQHGEQGHDDLHPGRGAGEEGAEDDLPALGQLTLDVVDLLVDGDLDGRDDLANGGAGRRLQRLLGEGKQILNRDLIELGLGTETAGGDEADIAVESLFFSFLEEPGDLFELAVDLELADEVAAQVLGLLFIIGLGGAGKEGCGLDEHEFRRDDEEVGQVPGLASFEIGQPLEVLIGDLREGDGGNVQLLSLDETEEQVERALEDG